MIEPGLRDSRGHYAEFVRALGAGAGTRGIDVFAQPAADELLRSMAGVTPETAPPRADRLLAEWRVIARATREHRPFLVLTTDGRHTAAASLAALWSARPLDRAIFYFHSVPRGAASLLLPLSAAARRRALAVAPTARIIEQLRRGGWQRTLCHPYPALGPQTPPAPTAFRHVLMAGAARLNKGLDLLAPMLESWQQQRRAIPVLVQISPKHAGHHGTRERALIDAVLNSGYAALQADDRAPDSAEYGRRFAGALVLAAYERARFADAVSGVVLDALLHGAPVVATRGTWPAAQVERFAAGVTIETRTPGAVSDAVDHILARWDTYTARACEAAVILAREHDPATLFSRLLGP